MKEAFVKSQILRLSGLDFFPPTTEAVRELMKSLSRHATSDDHAERIVSAAIDGANDRRCPTPADLARVAQQVPEARELPVHCKDCKGAPWVTVLRMVKSLGREYEAEVAQRCTCPRGIYFQQRDAERKGAV